MPIELTDKITPKNAAFADIVDAKNVGGDGTSSNALPADAVASPAALEIVRIDSTNQFLEGVATVPVASGGTGQTTANAALNALLPSQTSNSGKFLQTDGTNTSWAAGAGGSMVYPGAGIANSTGTAWGTSYTTTGSGTVVALQTSPSFTTPAIGAATGTSLDLSGGGGSISLAQAQSLWFGGSGTGTRIRQNASGNMAFSHSGSDQWNLTSAAFTPVTAGGQSLGTSTAGVSALYLDESGAGTETVAVVAPTLTSNVTVTMPAFNTTLGGRVASYDGTALTAVASNQLLASAAAGFYRISVFMICTRAATGGGAASTLGANTRVSYTPIGAAGPITHYIPMFIYGSALSTDATGTTVNFVDTVLTGSIVIYVASTAVVTYENGYTSTGTGTAMMRYNVSVRLERID